MMNNLPRQSALILSLMASGVVAAMAATPGAFLIVYKPSPGVVKYSVRQVDRLSDEEDAAKANWKISDVYQAVEQTMTAEPGGELRVNGGVMGESVFTSETPLDRPAPLAEPRKFTYTMNVHGGFAKAPDESNPTSVLLPRFPETAIAPGFEWDTLRPVAPGLNVPIAVSHEFKEVKVVQGMPCAIIVTEAQSKESFGTGQTDSAFKGHAYTAVSLTDGQLVELEAFTSLAVRSPAADGGPTRVLRHETLRTMVRGAAGEGDGAGQ